VRLRGRVQDKIHPSKAHPSDLLLTVAAASEEGHGVSNWPVYYKNWTEHQVW
jgi:hypothetical protein